MSAIQVASLTPTELAGLTGAGFQVADGYVEVTSSLAPAGTSVVYDGGTTNLYGGNGSITITGPAGGTSGGTSSGGGSSGGGTSGGYSGSGLSWTVSLSTSATHVQIGQSVTLTATTNQDVGPTPYWIIVESRGGTILNECGSGTTCSATETEATASAQTYTAVVAAASGSDIQAQSSPVSITWQAPSPTVSAPVFSPVPTYPGQQTCASVQATNASSVSLSLPAGGDLALSEAGNTWSGCFDAPGVGGYTLTASASGPGGSAQESGTLTVRAPVPTAAFSVSPNPVVADWQAVTYTDQSSGGGYGASIASEHWSVSGPGGSWSGASPSALPSTFQTPGTYTVTLAVTNSYGASASVSHTLTVRPAPTLSITASPSLAQPGQTVTVSAAWSGWTSASIDVSQFGAGLWPQAGSGTWSRPFTLQQSGDYSACVTGTIDGQTRQACASTTILVPTAPILTQ